MEMGMISVDRWSEGSQVYFLTHLHADHTKGLSSTWKRGPLFCSLITAKLLPYKFPDFNLSLIRVVCTGNWHSLSLLSPSSGSQVTVQAMAIDAHHCPGAVMYLFHGEFGCTLYTGDFQWERTSRRAQIGKTMLLNAIQNVKIDNLYLDNTYCNPSFSFPSRRVAAQQVVDIITSYPDHDIIIGIESLGKEDLLLYISSALNTKIWVWPERLQTMHILGLHRIFTTKTSETRVRAVPQYSFSSNTLEGLNLMRPTIGIMPSGLPWSLKLVGQNRNPLRSSCSISFHKRSDYSTNICTWASTKKPNRYLKTVEKYHQFIYAVPYTDHSCFSEIQEFIKLLQPNNIKGIVSSSPTYIDPLFYFGHLCRGNQASWDNSKLESEEERENLEDILTNRTFGRGNFVGAAIKSRRVTQHTLGVHLGRVNALRRVRRGVKIWESDSHD